MDVISDSLGLAGLVPVIKLASPDKAVPLGRALAAGGIHVMEVTFRSDAAEQSIRRLRSELPETLVGAGTVLTKAQAEQAQAAGAAFIVSPGWSEEVVDYCLERGLPVYPGVANADGVMRAVAKGLSVLKFFPAEASGGIAMLDALAGPFAGVKFIPTGGIDPANLAAYASKEPVLAIGGSWMVKPDLVEASDWGAVTNLTRQAVLALHGFRLAHVGINGTDAAEGRAAAALLKALFGLTGEEGNTSIMVGPDKSLELTLSPFPGAKGHLAIGVHNIERAVAYLARLGVKTVENSAKSDGKRLKSVYLELELNGFALHLLRV